MSPMEKLDEVVDAMEALDQYVEFGDYRDERDYNDALERFKAALTLARELRDSAVEGWVAPGRVVGVEFAADDGSFTPGPLSKPAILITDLTP